MATLEQLEAALVKADAAGNVDDARALAAEIRSMRGSVNSDFKPVTVGSAGMADAVKQELAGKNWADRQIIAAGTGLSNMIEGTKQLIPGMKADQGVIQANKAIASENPVAAFGGNAALAALPFGLVGSGLKSAAAVGGAYGALQPVESDNLMDIAKGKAISGAVGAGSALGGQYLTNKLLSGTSNQMAAVAQKVQDKAAKFAASETASARSAAGNAAQNAYRQLEHLRALGANRALTPDELITVQSLERELAEKALDKLMPAAALKQETSRAYSEAMETEAQRAADYAAKKLSGSEAKEQLMARVKRYGPMALGGAALGSLGGPYGAALGGAVGLYLRPALRSMVNLTQNPAVQYGLLSGANTGLNAAGQAIPVTGLLGSQLLFNQ
jgi:hypothetical protein